jgi:MoaE-MoaD fusion protein
MQIKVLFFASFKERTGVKNVEIELTVETTVLEFKNIIVDHFPVLRPYIPVMIVSVNRNFAFDQDRIPESAEVALFPPVSGGGNEYPTVVFITDAEIDFDALVEQISLFSTGAACMFSGMVRGITERGGLQRTDHLEYEAYVPMADEKMHQVAREMREKWPTIQGIAIVQRIGILYPRTPTVLVACTAAHRDTGIFEAARYGIDRLKEIVPIWKKETGPSGETWVEGEYLPGPVDL